jgi:type II secretory pathway pseudopilin PulG
LLVVVAIIAVLLALLLAAIQRARETANRVACAQNLHQLAIAIHAYQDSFDAIPPNYHEDVNRKDGSHNLFYGPLVRLLPYTEQVSTYRNFSTLYYDSAFPDPDSYGWPSIGGMSWVNHTWFRNPFNQPASSGSSLAPPNPLSCPNPSGRTNIVGQTWGGEGNVRLFSCPSQPYDHTSSSQAGLAVIFLQGIPTIDMPRGNPFWNPVFSRPECLDTSTSPTGPGCTVTAFAVPPANFVLGRSDYVAVVGAFHDSGITNPPMSPQFAQKYRSLFNYNVNASLARVPDGTSNTLLISEYCGSLSAGSPEQIFNGWNPASWAASGLSVAFGTCPDPNNSLEKNGSCDFDPTTGGGLGGGIALGGWHHGMFQVVFADGSVRPLRVGVDKALLFSLAGYNDGDVITADY